MSRSNKGGKGPGYEYWKSRCPKKKMEWHPGRETKKYTHKVERQENKEITDEDLENDNFDWDGDSLDDNYF